MVSPTENQAATIPPKINKIENYAFYQCYGLTDLTIPSNVTSIGDEAFAYCNYLTIVRISSGITNIGPGVFRDCYSLRNLTIPDSVVEIGSLSFATSGLTNIESGNGTMQIGPQAFIIASVHYRNHGPQV